MSGKRWFVDTSVFLAIVTGQSRAARRWFNESQEAGDGFAAAMMLDVEVWRWVRRRRVRGLAAPSSAELDDALARLHRVPLSDAIATTAIALDEPLRGADALHIASALTLGTRVVTLVTHDAEMALAATSLGFLGFDPVTDDPQGSPVF